MDTDRLTRLQARRILRGTGRFMRTKYFDNYDDRCEPATEIGDVTGSGELTIPGKNEVQRLRLYNRFLLIGEAMGNWRAGIQQLSRLKSKSEQVGVAQYESQPHRLPGQLAEIGIRVPRNRPFEFITVCFWCIFQRKPVNW